MRRRLLRRAGLVGAVGAVGIYTASFFVQNEVKRGSTAWLNAAQLGTLASLLNDVGAVVWPKYASDPFTCNTNAIGAYYYNTTSNDFRTCNGSSWSPNGGGVGGLTDFPEASLSSPQDNDVFRYVSADSLWGNSAAAARLVEDLSDVVITDEVFPELLQYNGSNWVDQSALPATLPGLTDTTITTPGDGDHLVHDGSDWKNQDWFVDEPVYVFDRWVVNGSSVSSDNIVDSPNQIRVWRIVVPYEITVDNIIWRTQSALSSGCSCQGIAVYSADGNTLHGSATFSQSGGLTSGTINNVDVDDFTIGPGEYWLAATGNYTAGIGWCSMTSRAGNLEVDTIRNTEAIKMGQGTNTTNATTCAFPSTLGTVTGDTNEHRAIIILEGR